MYESDSQNSNRFNDSELAFGLSDAWRAVRMRWGWGAAVAAAITTAAMAYTFTREANYRSEFLLQIGRASTPLDADSGNGLTAEAIDLEIRTLGSSPILTEIYQALPERDRNRMTLRDLQWNLSISPLGEGGLLLVSYIDDNPNLVQEVLETAGEIYVSYSRARLEANRSSAIAFVEASIEATQQELDASANRLREFREQYNIVNPDALASNITGTRFGVEQEIENLGIQIAVTSRLRDELRSQLTQAGQDPDVALSIALLSQDGAYTSLVEQLQTVETQIGLQQSRFRQDSPIIQSLQQERSSLLSLLQDRAEEVLGERPAEAQLGVVLPSAVPSLNSIPIDLGTPSIDGTQGAGGTRGAVVENLQLGLIAQLQAVELELSTMEARMAGLQQVESQSSAEFDNVPALQQTYTELQRQVDVNSTALNSLLLQLQELRIADAQMGSVWTVFEAPYLPTQPHSPNIPRNLLYGLMGGFVLGLGLPIAMELSDGRIRTDRQAMELTGLPLLGAIPLTEGGSPPDITLLPPGFDEPALLTTVTGNAANGNSSNGNGVLTGDAGQLPLLETPEDSGESVDDGEDSAYRDGDGYEGEFYDDSAVGTNGGTGLFREALGELVLNVLSVPSRNPNCKLMALTSATPGEGKSTIACNLGKMLAQVGKSVLVIDCDFMHSTVHHYYGFPNDVGLSTIFMNPRMDWRAVVRSVDNSPSLHAIATGPPFPNPLMLFLSERMKQLIADWQDIYDFVLFDTPPLVGVADAQSIANLVDGVVLVVSLDVATKTAVLRATEILEGDRGKIAGLVLNRLEPTEAKYYGKDNYYSSNYYNRRYYARR